MKFLMLVKGGSWFLQVLIYDAQTTRNIPKFSRTEDLPVTLYPQNISNTYKWSVVHNTRDII